MEFHDYRTLWDFFKKYSERGETAQDFYRQAREMGTSQFVAGNKYGPGVVNQSLAEQSWIDSGKPYYKVYPDMLHLLLRTKLDVPSEYLRTPFKSFCVRLPKGHQIPELTVEGYEARAILVDEAVKEIFVGSSGPDVKDSRSIVAWIDFGEDEKNFVDYSLLPGVPVVTYSQLLAKDGKSIEECIRKDMEGTDGRVSDEGVPITVDVTNACFRIVVSVCFLATGADKIIEPDVLSNDFRRYVETDDKGLRDRLIAKAHRRGKRGWTVGREICFPYRDRESHGVGESGRELKHSHIRSAHFHAYRYGVNRSLVKVKFVRQLTVRPDLPPSPVRRGYSGK